ncbi:MAG: tetratricopeptide repeat protein [Thaumarchaeota archaeon]|nr:tetratricopeptide repeat protein [Nitrososphaerota archaeon]
MSGGQRRLAAIVFTDMVGYSAIAQRDEPLALKLLDTQNELVRSVLKNHQGREVKTIGDAFLLEFESALDAVLCSLEIQNAVSERNQRSPDTERILLRIGIHAGDVIHRDGDVFGDAVNIASRVVSYSEAGSICVSEQVYYQIRNKVQYAMTRIPEQSLKNVEEKIDLYQIGLQSKEPSGTTVAGDRRRRIAVLPFANISPDPNDGYFADGLTDELISTLSGVHGLRVIARTSVARYKETDRSVPQIGNELQAAFLLEGSVRKAGNKVRVNAQLVDVESQEDIWSNHYDRELDDVFSIQNDIARRVSDSLQVTIHEREQARVGRKETQNSAAYIAYLKGRTFLHEGTEKAVMAAKRQFEAAIQEDPRYAKAHSGLADCYMLLSDYLFAPVPNALADARASIERALSLDPDLPEALASQANLCVYDYKFAEAEMGFRRAIALNPSYASAHHWYSICLAQFGRYDDAWREVTIAQELDPLSSAIAISVFYRAIMSGRLDEAQRRIRKLEEIDPASPLVLEARMAYSFARKEWGDALVNLRKMIEADPSDPFLEMDLGYIYGVTGKKQEALELTEKLKKVDEGLRIKGQALAFVYAGLGDLDESFRWLDFAIEKREIFVGWFRGYPLLENVKRDPRFADVLRRTHLN